MLDLGAGRVLGLLSGVAASEKGGQAPWVVVWGAMALRVGCGASPRFSGALGGERGEFAEVVGGRVVALFFVVVGEDVGGKAFGLWRGELFEDPVGELGGAGRVFSDDLVCSSMGFGAVRHFVLPFSKPRYAKLLSVVFKTA